jgi:hypothetical protein
MADAIKTAAETPHVRERVITSLLRAADACGSEARL